MVHLRDNHEGWENVRWSVIGACKPAFFDRFNDAKKYAFECNEMLKKEGYPHHSIFVEWRAK